MQHRIGFGLVSDWLQLLLVLQVLLRLLLLLLLFSVVEVIPNIIINLPICRQCTMKDTLNLPVLKTSLGQPPRPDCPQYEH